MSTYKEMRDEWRRKSTPPDLLCLSVRAANVARNAGLTTVEEFANFTITRLLKIRNCGMFTVREIQDELKKRGLDLKPELTEVKAEMESTLVNTSTYHQKLRKIKRLIEGRQKVCPFCGGKFAIKVTLQTAPPPNEDAELKGGK